METFPVQLPLHTQRNFQVKELLFCVVAFLLSVKCFKSIFKSKKIEEGDVYKAYRELPGPSSIPFFGIPWRALSRLLDADLIGIALDLSKRYGPCYKLNFMNDEYVVLNSPEYVQAILTSNDNRHFDKADLEHRLWPEGVESLIIFTGDEWRRRRKMLNRSFTYKSLMKYNLSFNKHSGKLVRDLHDLFRDGKVHSITKLIRTCIFRQSSETLMGVDLEYNQSERFVKSIERAMDLCFDRMVKPWLMIPGVFRLLHGNEYNECLQIMGQITQRIVYEYKMAQMKENCENNNDCGRNEGENDDSSTNECVIETMLRHGIPTEKIAHEVGILLGTANDTTSLATEQLLFLLALYPEHQRRCQEEIDKIFEDHTKFHDGILEYTALTDLKYLEKCIQEEQRIYPLASLLRRLETPLKLSENLVIPAGANVAYVAHMLHLNPELFPNPEKFDPGRFAVEEVRKRHPYSYVPFSAGPRICIGMKLALIELKIVVAKILRNFDVYTTDKREDMKLAYKGLPHPVRPINFIFKRRQLTPKISFN